MIALGTAFIAIGWPDPRLSSSFPKLAAGAVLVLAGIIWGAVW